MLDPSFSHKLIMQFIFAEGDYSTTITSYPVMTLPTSKTLNITTRYDSRLGQYYGVANVAYHEKVSGMIIGIVLHKIDVSTSNYTVNMISWGYSEDDYNNDGEESITPALNLAATSNTSSAGSTCACTVCYSVLYMPSLASSQS